MSAPPSLHMLKLCVGAEGVQDLQDWQRGRLVATGSVRHVTRMWPRRAAELLAGGSLYWVIKGLVLARQRILALAPEDGEDGVRRCALVLDPALVRTEAQPRRPFQGWRYLSPAEAPPDAGAVTAGPELPAALQAALAELGVTRRRA